MSELLIGTRKGLFQVNRDGWRVERVDFLGVPVVLAVRDPRDGTRYAALKHGHFGIKVHRSKDGVTWDEIGVPTYPDKPDDVEDIEPGRKQPVPWSLLDIWALSAGGKDQPGRLWAGTIPGGLFRSDDHGDNWELVRSLWDDDRRKQWFGGGADFPAIHTVCVDPRNSERVVLGVSCGGVWVTEDDGATWDCRADGMRAAYMPPEQAHNPNIQDPHQLAMCPSSPDVIWAQHHNGIFKTENGCESWTEIENVSPSAFGFAVAVHPNDPNTAWFVPAQKDELRIPVDGKVVVTRTRDGGKSFEVLRDGLPQEHAYDLTLRHALDVSSDGDTLAFGTTTGSVWVSEDQGDHWQTVAANLPPVYSVRLAM